MKIRNVHESDYSYIITRINQWWGGKTNVGHAPKIVLLSFSGNIFCY